MKQRDIPPFEGFVDKHTVAIPDAVFDHLLGLLTGAELKVLLYIMRRTYGFQKCTDTISLSQFQDGIVTKDERRLDYGCGIRDRQTIIDALASLEAKNCIVIEKGDTQTSPIAYTIFFSCELVDFPDPDADASRENQPVEEMQETTSRNFPTNRLEKPTSTSRNFPTQLVGKPYIQETVLQETVLQETGEEKKAPDETPSQSKTFHRTESKNPTQPKLHLVKPHQGTVQEPRPPTRKELERQNEQRRETAWACAEAVLRKTYKPSFRTSRYSIEPLNTLLADYSDEEIKHALEHLTQWERARFTWEKFIEWIPNYPLRESPPPAVIVEPQEIRPTFLLQRVEEEERLYATSAMGHKT